MVLLLFFMVLAPANRRFALDAKEKSVNWMPNWVRLFFILQLLIVYTYASINKMYPHWVDGTTMSVFMYAKRDYWLIGPYLQGKPFQLTVSYMAIAYDGLIIPAMLWRRTRTLAFIASVGFHVFNAIVFGVGIFPFMSLALFIFFFDPKAVNGAFFRGRAYFSNENSFTNQSQLIGVIFSLYFLIQIGLPLRHRFIDGNVFWTEEGHRMSWRMMLRSKGGHCHFLVYDENGRFRKRVKVGDIVHKSQSGKIKGRPDMILSFVRYVEQKIKDEEGFEPQIYCVSRVNLNGGPSLPLIDRDVDLTKVKWNPYGHNEWILSYPFTLNGK